MVTQAKVVTGDKVRHAVTGVGWTSRTALLPRGRAPGNSEVVALVSNCIPAQVQRLRATLGPKLAGLHQPANPA